MTAPDPAPSSTDVPEVAAVPEATADAAVPADGTAAATAAIVDWGRTARRLRRQLVVIGALVLLAWLAIGLATDRLGLRLLAELSGFGLLLAFVAEVVVVGGAAVRGLLAAGERGDRLAGSDVALLPPQLRRRR